MNRPWTTRILGLVMAMTLVTAACGSEDAAVGTGDCDSVDAVSLQLQWVTQAQFAGYFAAVDRESTTGSAWT